MRSNFLLKMNRLAVVATAVPMLVGSSLAVAADGPNPQMKAVLDSFKGLNPKPFHTVKPEAARKGPTPTDAVAALLKKQEKPSDPEKMAMVDDRTIPGATAKSPIEIRVYAPVNDAKALPGIVYFHGGGFVVADLDVYDATPRALAKGANAVVVSVHYRQAPEHALPAAHEDALTAYRYIQSHAKEFGIDANRIAVAGESAGANLATSVAIRQQRDGKPEPVQQLLVYPFVTNDLTSASHVKNGTGNYLIGNKDIEWFWKNALGPNWNRSKNPEVLPIFATTDMLKGTAPAFIVSASLDPLLDEGIAYGKKLEAAGVPVTQKTYEGVTHEFFGMAPVLDVAKQAQKDAIASLKKAFETAPAMGGSGDTAPTMKTK